MDHSVQYHVSGARKCLHVDLARDVKLDNLAVEYCDSLINSSLVAPGRPCSPNSRRNRLTLAQGSIKHGDDKVTSDHERWTSNHGGRVRTPPCDAKSKQALPDASSHNGSETTTLLDSEGCRTLKNTSGQDGCGKTSTSDGRNGQQTLANSFNPTGPDIPTGSSSSSRSNLQNGIAKDDFMSLLSLSPTQVIHRARKCTFHWRGKYLHIKARNLWNKICGEKDYRYSKLLINTAKRPCSVSVERCNVIDRLALLTNPQSVNLSSFSSKPSTHKKLSFTSRRRCLFSPKVLLKRNSALQVSEITSSSNLPEAPKLSSSVPCSTRKIGHSAQNMGRKRLFVKIIRDSSLDHLAREDFHLLRTDSHASNLPEATVTSTSSTAISHFAEKLSRGRACVQIERDSGLDKLILQNSNLLSDPPSSSTPETTVSSADDAKLTISPPLPALATVGFKKLLINIHRDSRLDQLALQHVSSAGPVEGPNNLCHVNPRHQTTLEPSNSMTSTRSTRSPAEDLESLNDSCQARLGFLTNLDNAGISDSRRGIIKLRRISCGDWCVIQPEVPSLKTAGLNYADVEMIVDDKSMMQPPSSNSGSSSGSERPSAEHVMNSNVGRSPTLDSEHSEDSCCKTACEVPLNTDQSALYRLPSEQDVPEGRPGFCSSTRRSNGMQQTVGLVPSTKSTRKRTKSVPSKEETPAEKHDNENENPQLRAIVSFRHDEVLSSKVVTPLVLRRSCKTIAEDLPGRPHTRATRRKDLNFYNLVKPSISRYMPVKKPLGQQSPNSQSM